MLQKQWGQPDRTLYILNLPTHTESNAEHVDDEWHVSWLKERGTEKRKSITVYIVQREDAICCTCGSAQSGKYV